MRVAADSVVARASRNVNEYSYQNPKWMQLQHVFHDLEEDLRLKRLDSEETKDAYRWRSGWRDMCSEWFVLMLSNHVLRARDEATAFVLECESTDPVLPEPLRCLRRHLKELRDRQLEMG